MERAKLLDSAVEMAYIKRVLKERSNQLARTRSFYFQEVNELKYQLAYFCQVQSRNQPTEILAASLREFPCPERDVFVGLLNQEREKTEKLQTWVSNLKMQLKVEKLRHVQDSDMTPRESTISMKNPIQNQNRNFFQSQYIEELQAKIIQLENQLKSKIAITQAPTTSIYPESAAKSPNLIPDNSSFGLCLLTSIQEERARIFINNSRVETK